MNATVEKYLEPVQQLNALAITNIEKLVKQQVKFLNETSEIGLGQLRSATEIKDIEGLQSYIQGQAEAAKTMSERLLAESKYITELGTEYSNEVQKIFKEAAATK